MGYLTFLVPTLIMTYYSVIGGWITKYFTLYLVSSGDAAAQDGFFTSFITSPRLAHRLHADLFGADGVGRVLRR